MGRSPSQYGLGGDSDYLPPRGASLSLCLRSMDTELLLTTYLASSSRIGIRPWNRRSDRRKIGRWPPYFPALPAHWLAAPPASGVRVSYAIDLLSGSGLLVGKISLLLISNGIARLGIALHPNHLGNGIGVEAFGLIPKIVARQGVALIQLDVAESNTRAYRCYARSGFIVVGNVSRGGYCYHQMEQKV